MADGSLDARDFARFSGRFRVTVPAVAAHAAGPASPSASPPSAGRADIYSDLVLVTPDAAWPEHQLAFTVRGSANRSRFVLAGCNVTGRRRRSREVGFRYVVIDLP